MIKGSFAVTILFFLIILLAGQVLAVQPAQLMRSNELNEKQGQLMDQLRNSRAYVINDYAFSGIELTPEQSAVLEKLIDPVRGNFLKKTEVDDLCHQVRDYIHKEVAATGRISCILEKQVLKIEYDK